MLRPVVSSFGILLNARVVRINGGAHRTSEAFATVERSRGGEIRVPATKRRLKVKMAARTRQHHRPN